MPRLSSLVWLASLAVAASGLNAQTTGPDVVVTARKLGDRAETRRLASAITQQIDGQAARFDAPVCPASIGLPPALNTIVRERIGAIARAAGIPVAKAGCRPTVTLLLVENGAAEVAAVYRGKPWLFEGMDVKSRRRLLAERGPVRVMTLSQTRTRDGRPVPRADAAEGARAPAPIGGPTAPRVYVDNASIIDLATRQDLTGALVMIDKAAALGKSLRQLADYAAMRGLAQTRPATGDTILALFDDPAAPRELSPFDAAYLEALYHTSALQPGNARLTAIAGRITTRMGGH